MRTPSDHIFLTIEAAAHSGAMGHNRLPEPTEGQKQAGNYKMGRVSVFGLPLVIEQPRNTYRSGIAADGKRWTTRLAAHYGYIAGTRGADGEGVDCFIGPHPQSDVVFVVNQFVNGSFDEHKVMLCFTDEAMARRAYLDSFERGWNGLQSIVPVTIHQFKWWLQNGHMGHPIQSENLPTGKTETMLKRVQWNADAQPYGQTLDRVLYDLRRADPGNLLLDAVSMADILEDSDGVMLLDAMTTPFSQLPRMMAMLKTGMEHFSATVKPLDVTISEPFSARGVANVSAIFSLSDGQNLSVYFHNPDTKPKSIGANDEMISWKWMLNKLDVTIVVAPERGKELNIREVARRIMKLAEKNSAAFQRANGKRAERMKKIEGLKEEVAALEVELAKAQKDLEVAKLVAEERAIKAVEADRYLPPGWSGLPGGIATSTDPVSGGIVDKEVVSGKWFYIAENSAINKGTGFNTRAEALAALEAQVQAVAAEGMQTPTPEPAPGEEQNPHVKALRDLAAGKNDGQELEWMFNIIQGAIDGLEEVNQLTGDNEAAANAAITHWAEFEERLNG